MQATLNSMLRMGRKFIPHKIFMWLQPAYHYTFSFLGAVWYRFPSKKIKIIAVTGTKGKSSTVEILNTILETAGKKTALSNTIRFKIGSESWDNLYKMSMPGRFFMQQLIRKAVNAGCEYMVMEITSQGVLQHRHRFINLDTLIITNISPEHIEAHGSYEAYLNAKLEIARTLVKSSKRPRNIVVNADDAECKKFLDIATQGNIETALTYSTKSAEPFIIKKSGIDFMWAGLRVSSLLSGLFNLSNILAAATSAKNEGISAETIKQALQNFDGIRGRVEKINEGQDFTVVVDYAHTTDSLEKLYQVFQGSKIIGVLGGTGGGRDTWKRSEMGRIADKYCEEIILTNEDPYDESPEKIIADVKSGITESGAMIIMDRREAIAKAISLAHTGDAVLITGKGTDPYIMGPNGTKTPWDDAEVAKEEIRKLFANK